MNIENQNQSEFLQFLNGVKPLIIKIASAYCFDKAHREDLIQDIILQMWHSFERYNPDYAPSTWTYRIALNVSISYLRKESTRKKRMAGYEDLVMEWHEPMSDDPRLDQLYVFIQTLKSLDKAIMVLILEECKNKEISEILGISDSNVSTRINRIKKQMTTYFQTQNK